MKYLMIVAAFVLVGCSGPDKNPMAPAPTPVSACVRDNTGTLIIVESSRYPRDVYIDGTYIGTSRIVGETVSYTVTAGTHRVSFYSAQTGVYISGLDAYVPQCSSFTVTNSYSADSPREK